MYSHMYFRREPMLRPNIKAAGNSDGHWSSETLRAGKDHRVEMRCSTPTPKPSIQTGGCNPNALGVGVLSEDPSL